MQSKVIYFILIVYLLIYFNCSENRVKIKNKAVVIAVPFEEDNPETAAPIYSLNLYPTPFTVLMCLSPIFSLSFLT